MNSTPHPDAAQRPLLLNRKQLGALERFFGGYRDRQVSVYQEVGSDRATFFAGSYCFRVNHIGVELSLADVEALIVEIDASGATVAQLNTSPAA